MFNLSKLSLTLSKLGEGGNEDWIVFTILLVSNVLSLEKRISAILFPNDNEDLCAAINYSKSKISKIENFFNICTVIIK